ncbi:MAG: hypothetical protein JWN45_2853 [Acidobacteriaceae bacterium]|nr:hypothetical protein [Acidobacteriaceae bacterium]
MQNRNPLNLYRRMAVFGMGKTVVMAAGLLCLLLALPGGAQSPKKKDKGPRAIAVVQWQADGKGLAVPRLLPVAILSEGKFYDAGLYRASPIPMALQTETVYEAQDKGELLGFFTIKRGFRTSTEDRNWVGLGAWQSASPKADTNFSKLNSRSSAEIVRGITSPTMDMDPADTGDDRNYNRKKTTVYDENGKEIPPGSAGSSKDDTVNGRPRPTLRRPSQSGPPDSTSDKAGDKTGDNTRGGSTTTDEQKTKSGSQTTAGGSSDPDRPTLKRRPDSDGDKKADDTKQKDDKSTASKTDNDPDRPTLKRGADSSSDKKADDAKQKDDKSTAGKADADPDRPKIRRGKPTGETQVASASTAGKQGRVQDSDPNHPILKRGKPASRVEEEQQSVARPVPERILQRGSSAPIMAARARSEGGILLPKMRTYEVVAVSDASAKEQEAFRFRWTDDEKRELSAKMSVIAQKEVDAFLKSIGRAPVGGAIVTPATPARTARAAKAAQAAPVVPKTQFAEGESQVTGLDLAHNNSPTVVFSGRERLSNQPGAQQVFVTVVARVDLEGNPRKLFANVTTSDRLDATPWLEFIDAIDADGDGRGELLFRRIRDVGSEFAIYHVGVDELAEMFHGGTAE